MKYLSVCSGIEAASVAWEPLGWTPVAFSEIEPFPSAVLAHRFPNVPNLGDMTKHGEWTLHAGAVELLIGGTPCQSFSVAGLRKGLHDPRGGLMLTYLEIAQRLRPRWIVWENVPGVLSSGSGRDFGSFLGALGQLGYKWAYRVLDAQWVRTHRHPRAVPQRRRRVFVVGCLVERSFGDRNPAAEVLFKSESVQRNLTARKAQGQGAAADASGCAGAGGTGLQPVVIDRAAFNQGRNAQYDPHISHSHTMDALVARGPHAVAQATDQVSGTIAARFGSSRNNHEECVTQPVVGALCAGDAKHIGSQYVNQGKCIVQPVPVDVASPTITARMQGSAGWAPYNETAHLIPMQPVPIQDGREMEKAQNGIGVGQQGDPSYTLDQTGGQSIAYSIREDATAGNFSATPIDVANAVTSLRPSPQSHHAQTFVTQKGVTFALDEYNQTGHEEVCYPLRTASGDGIPKVNVTQAVEPVVFQQNTREEVRLIDGDGQIAGALSAEAGSHQQNYVAQPVAFTKSKRAQSNKDDETWVQGQVNPTLSLFDQGDTRATTVAVAFSCGNLARRAGASPSNEVAPTMSTTMGDQQTCVVHGTVAFPIDTQNMTEGHSSGGLGFGQQGDPSFTVTKAHSHAVAHPTAFGIYGGNKRADRPEGGFYARQEDTARTLDAAHGLNPTCSQGGTAITQPPAVAMRESGRGYWMEDAVAGTIDANMGMSGHANRPAVITQPPAVAHPAAWPAEVAPTLAQSRSGSGSPGYSDQELFSQGAGNLIPQPNAMHGHDVHAVACPTLTAHNDPSRSPQSAEVTQQVAAVHATTMTVRRLTPRECERLQGFPDDWTLIPWRKKNAEDCPDGPRYKALGNSMAVNCMEWIGQRIAEVNETLGLPSNGVVEKDGRNAAG